MLRILTVIAPVLFIMGCSPRHDADPPRTPPPPAKTVFDPLTQQLERARGVQNTVDQNATDTRRAVDASERGDAPAGGERNTE